MSYKYYHSPNLKFGAIRFAVGVRFWPIREAWEADFTVCLRENRASLELIYFQGRSLEYLPAKFTVTINKAEATC